MVAIPEQYLIPSRDARNDKKLGWLREAWQEGDAHLRAQRAYRDISAAMRLMAGDESPDELPPEISHVYANRLKRQIREVVAVFSQINPVWYYESTDPRPEYQEVGQTLNKLLNAWWYATSADLKLRKANQYATALGTAWINPVWVKARGRYGRGHVDLDVLGPQQVRVLQPTADNDIQKAYMTIITKETPVNLARFMFPQHADKIKSNRDVASYGGHSRAMKLIERLGQLGGAGSVVMNKFGAKKPFEHRRGSYPTVDIHYGYVNDLAINPHSDRELFMGEPGTSWYYKVPYRGQEIPTNQKQNGQVLFRKADFEDAMIYPMRRLVIWTDTWVLYDNTSSNWHGNVPLAKLVVDDWPWEMLGYGMLRDGESLQKEMNRTLRGIGDRVQLALRPPLGFDENVVSKGTMDKFDPRKPGSRVQMNLALNPEGIKTLLGPEFLRVMPEHMQYVQMLADFMDHQMAVTDLRNLAKAKQLPSDRTIDKMLEIAGPLVQDMTRVQEGGIRDTGQMVGSMFFQHYDMRRLVQEIGERGLRLAPFAFDPESLWPPEKRTLIRSMEAIDRHQHIREFIQNFSLKVTPGSLHEITQTTHKLMLFQLWRDPAFPLDPGTLAEAFKLRNFWTVPQDMGVDTIYDKWKAWMGDMTQFQGALQGIAMMAGLGMDAGAGGGGGGGEGKPNGSAAGSGGGGGGNVGRPPSGQESPRIEQKDGGTRSTISES